MKKLMILAVAVVASVAANAAAITWGSGTVYLADGTTKAGKGVVTAYLFTLDATTYGTLAASASATALSDAVYAAYGSSTGSATASITSTAKGLANLTDPNSHANGDTVYAAVLYIDGDNYMGNVGTYTLTSDLDYTVAGMATTVFGSATGTTATAWSSAAVPEPTSGLLMLLGMAGLALRRRRA